MKRRTFILGTGSIAAGGSALLGSGAFSRVESQRSVSIQVAEDPNAYLGLDKCRIDGQSTPNSSYAWLDDDGHLELLLNPENPTIEGNDPDVADSPLGEGVNSDSRTWVDNVFRVSNQGKEAICLYIEDNSNWPTFDGEGAADEKDGEERRVQFYPGAARHASIVGEGNTIRIDLGESICIGLRTTTIGLGVDEKESLLEEFDDEIRIVADVDCLGFPPEEVPGYPTFQVDFVCGEALGEIHGVEDETYSSEDALLRWKHGTYDGSLIAGEEGDRTGGGASCAEYIVDGSAEIRWNGPAPVIDGDDLVTAPQQTTVEFELEGIDEGEEVELSYASYGSVTSGWCKYEKQRLHDAATETYTHDDVGETQDLTVGLPPLADTDLVGCDPGNFDDDGNRQTL
jgi:hypothetical protein